MSAPSFREQLERYCYVHNRRNIPKIDTILKQFAGREESMIETLQKKYGPLPSDDEATRSRLTIFFERYNRDRLASIETIMNTYVGPKRAELFPALVAKYGPEIFGGDEESTSPTSGATGGGRAAAEPATPSASRASFGNDTRARLVRFMEAYNPEKLNNIDGILTAYAGRETEMFEALVKKYGPEPAAAGETPASVRSPPPATPAPATPGGNSNDVAAIRNRIVALYQHYAPDKVRTVDGNMEKYKGQEMALLEALIKKYGPEPQPGAAASPVGTPASSVKGGGGGNRERLTRFMEAYNPGKLGDIDKILQAYAGRETEMFEALVKKYGPEPTGGVTSAAAQPVAASSAPQSATASAAPSAANDHRSRLIRFMEAYNPAKLADVDKILQAYAGKESDMFEALVKKYGPEPQAGGSTSNNASAAPIGASDHRSRLTRFMEAYNPGKLGDIDKILQAYAGRETEMFDALVKKYGPEPTVAQRSGDSASRPPPVANDHRSRLIRFMEAYNPSKLGDVDKILSAYNGREVEMFEALVKKYGPEPVVQNAVSAEDMRATVTTFLADRGITAEEVLLEFPESDLLLSLHRAYGPLPNDRDIRTRLHTILQRYQPEKLPTMDAILKAYAGRDAEMIDALVKKYGPEPVPLAEGETNAVRNFLSVKRVTWEDAMFAVFPTMTNLLDYLKEAFGDYEARLRRFFVRHCPEDLDGIEELLENHRGDEEALLLDLVKRLGPEPSRNAPTRIITMLNSSPSSRLRRMEEEEAVSDREDAEEGDAANLARTPTNANKLPNDPPAVVKEGHVLLQDSERAPPEEYSGDESKAFPGEEEYWLQLRIGGDRATLDMSPAEVRRRSYTEYNPEMSDGETGSPMSARFRSESSFNASPSNGYSPPTSPPSAPQATPTATVAVSSKLGQFVAELCLPCSKKVVAAYDALWQPVGPGHKKLLSSSTTKEGFIEKLSNSRLGTKWQRRYFRVNDKGILYYETNQANEKPKGYKVLTRRSVLKENIDARTNAKCNDPNFFYFSVSCNETNEEFLLRLPSAEERAGWAAFFNEALERVKLTTTGQDPIPARWRARVAGAKLSVGELVVQTEESNRQAKLLQAKRDALVKQLEEEAQLLDITKTRAEDLVAQKKQLETTLHDLTEQVGAAEEAAELQCLSAAEAAAQVVLQREGLDKDLVGARQNVQSMTQAIIELEKKAVELEHIKNHEHLKLQQVFQKWRNVEQRPDSHAIGVISGVTPQKSPSKSGGPLAP